MNWFTRKSKEKVEAVEQTEIVEQLQIIEPDKIAAHIAALPYEGQRDLFDTAIYYKNIDALKTILAHAKIKPDSLNAAFYNEATHNYSPLIARVLVANPNTNVNWINKKNYNYTPAIRAAENNHAEIVNMIIDRKDFDPNIVITSKDYLSVPYENTLVIKVFGYMTKDSIQKPKEDWKRRLLNDPRIDWDLHAELITKAVEQRKLSQKESNRVREWAANQEDLETKLAPVRQALGLQKLPEWD